MRILMAPMSMKWFNVGIRPYISRNPRYSR